MYKHYNMIFVLALFIVSCKTNRKQDIQERGKKVDSLIISNQDFRDYLSNFKTIELIEIKNMNNYFNDQFLARDDKLIQIPKNYKKLYIPDLKADYVFYAFKLIASNQSIITIMYIEKADANVETADSSLFALCLYNKDSKLIGYLYINGSNLDETLPSYNLRSQFVFTKKCILVKSYDYCINKKDLYSGNFDANDSTYNGVVTIKDYLIDIYKNKIILNKSEKSKAKIKIIVRNPEPAILKLIEPKIE